MYQIFCKYLDPVRCYWHFMKLSMAAVRHLGFGEVMGPPTKAHLSWLFPVNFCHDQFSTCSLKVIRIWICCCSRLKVQFMGLKCYFWGLCLWSCAGTLFRPPERRVLRAMTRFEPSLVQIGRSAPCTCSSIVYYTQAFHISENLGKFGGAQIPHQTSQENSTKDASVSECTWTLSALEALRNALYKFKTYLLWRLCRR